MSDHGLVNRLKFISWQCTGQIDGNPVIVAVNGEGEEAEIHIVHVKYSEPGQGAGNRDRMVGLLSFQPPKSHPINKLSQTVSPSPGLSINLIVLFLAFIFCVCTFIMYTEVKKALEICVVVMNSMRDTAVVML